MRLTTGTRLGPYEIAGPVGAGGMGEVYRARDTRLQRDVALKLLPAALAGDQSALREVWFGGARRTNLRSLYALSLSGRVRRMLSSPDALYLDGVLRSGAALVRSETQRFNAMGVTAGQPKPRNISVLDFWWAMKTTACATARIAKTPPAHRWHMHPGSLGRRQGLRLLRRREPRPPQSRHRAALAGAGWSAGSRSGRRGAAATMKT